jgi:integral membrane protein (TIGR01906 family)
MRKLLPPLLKLTWSVLAAFLLVAYLFPYTLVFLDFEITQFHSLIDYLTPPWQTSLDADFFSQEDIWHMEDVQRVFKTVWLALILLTPILVVSQRTKINNKQRRLTRRQRLLGLTLILSVLATAMIFWQPLFVLFHQLVFPYNSYWQLDPLTSNVIKYFPSGVFQTLFLTWMLLAAVVYAAINTIPSRWRGYRPALHGAAPETASGV